MSIRQLAPKRAPVSTATIGDMDFAVRYVSAAEFRQALDSATSLVFDPKAKERVSRADDATLGRNLSDFVSGWRRVTLRKIAAFVVLDIPAEVNVDEEIPFDRDTVAYMIENNAEFAQLFADAVRSPATFMRERLEAEVKN